MAAEKNPRTELIAASARDARDVFLTRGRLSLPADRKLLDNSDGNECVMAYATAVKVTPAVTP